MKKNSKDLILSIASEVLSPVKSGISSPAKLAKEEIPPNSEENDSVCLEGIKIVSDL